MWGSEMERTSGRLEVEQLVYRVTEISVLSREL